MSSPEGQSPFQALFSVICFMETMTIFFSISQIGDGIATLNRLCKLSQHCPQDSNIRMAGRGSLPVLLLSPNPYLAWAHLGMELRDVRSPLREVEKLGGGKGRDSEKTHTTALPTAENSTHTLACVRSHLIDTHTDQQELNYRVSG